MDNTDQVGSRKTIVHEAQIREIGTAKHEYIDSFLHVSQILGCGANFLQPK